MKTTTELDGILDQATGRVYLQPQPRVTVYGKGGTAVYAVLDDDGYSWIGVRLDAEGARIDEWQPVQVELAR